MKLPEIKKEVAEFLSEESGVITKESIIKTGIIIGGMLALAKTATAACEQYDHTNSLSLEVTGGNTAIGSHNHHAQHCSLT